MERQINIFVSYSHLDANWVSESDPNTLIPWLASCLRKHNVKIWYDHALKKLPGEEYKSKIKSEIEAAHISILLLSQDFANSDFISDYELPWIKERVDANKMVVIPILVAPTLFSSEPRLKWVCERQMLPGKPTPLINYTNNKADFSRVKVEILDAILNRIEQLSPPITPPSPPLPPLPPSPHISFKLILSVLIPLLILVIAGYFLIKNSSGDLKRSDYKSLEQTADEYAVRIRKDPFIALTEKENLKILVQKVNENEQFENKLPRTAAILYRLYSAALLLTQTQSLIEQTKQSLPWLQKSLELYTGFKDLKELKDSKSFLNELVTGQIKDVDAEIFIAHNLRVAMIEATAEEVRIMSKQIVEKIITIKNEK